MMFIYKDNVVYNNMGIRGSLEELYKQAKKISEEIFLENPKSKVKTEIYKYI